MNAGKTGQLALAVCVAVAATCPWLAGCSKPSAATLKESKYEYAILKDGIALKNKQARFPLSFTTLVKMVGKPSRTKKGENLIHTWDDIGLAGRERPGLKHIPAAFS